MTPAGAGVRAIAAQIVDAVLVGGQSLDTAMASFEGQVSDADRSLLRMLCYGTLRNHWRLNEWVAILISKPLRKRDRVIASLLSIGLFQIVEMRIPDHAVVSETVEATRVLRRPKLAGLMNACLRRFVREDLGAVDARSDASRWNHPAWMIERLRRDWPDDWPAILDANNTQAPMWLRVNASRQCAADYLETLQAENIDASLLDGVADAVRLAQPVPVESLPGFSAGDVSVQDAAAQIAARWLLQNVSGHILDACAAPGGKTGHLLEVGGSDVSVTAVDNDAARIVGINENLARIGQTATITAADASNLKQWWNGRPFDGILLDAPCSASGVIRRHPDIKILRREKDLFNLAKRQKDLLETLWRTLAPGGTLLYVTCSVFAAENNDVTSEFLETHDDAVENDVLLNNNIRDLMRRKTCGYQVLPGTSGLDGFFYASFRKSKVS